MRLPGRRPEASTSRIFALERASYHLTRDERLACLRESADMILVLGMILVCLLMRLTKVRLVLLYLASPLRPVAGCHRKARQETLDREWGCRKTGLPQFVPLRFR
jgi:hypothetical protein